MKLKIDIFNFVLLFMTIKKLMNTNFYYIPHSNYLYNEWRLKNHWKILTTLLVHMVNERHIKDSSFFNLRSDIYPAKGQLISKANCQAIDSPKKTNQRICFFWLEELLCSEVKCLLFFIFSKNLRRAVLFTILTYL